MSFRLIPTDQRFYELFADQAAVAAEGGRVLESELRDYVDPSAAADRLRDLEHRGDDINHEVLAHLESTFVTPFERHDIHDLTGVLDDIIDLAEKVADMLVLYHVPVPPPGAADQATILAQACDGIVEGVGSLMDPVELRAFPPRIHALEKEGDRLRRRNIERLFEPSTSPLAVLTGEEIYEGLEDSIDAADRVGRVLERIGATYGAHL
jgi:uncharacterized protein Yka (UPF0111/DUF47 family)